MANVFVAGVVSITPEIRIDLGGGEIGDYHLLGVALSRERATDLTREHADEQLDEYVSEEWDWDTYEEVVGYFDYAWRYEIKETELIA